MQNYSKSLFEYIVKNKSPKITNNSDDDDLEEPSKPTRDVYAEAKKKETETDHTNKLVPYTQNAEIASSQSTKNKSFVMNTTAGYVIMYIQNDVMMFKNVI